MDKPLMQKKNLLKAFSVLPIWLAGATILLTACAATTNPQASTEQIAVSNATLTQAVSAGAPELAPAEMRSARAKMDRANTAIGAKDFDQARVLAEQAQVDAQLALSKARSAKAQKAAAAVQEDSRVLREEIERKAN